MKKILITGANSYIGTAVKQYLKKKEGYEIDTLDMHSPAWENKDFSIYDTIFHVAGIAHVDTRRLTDQQKKMYYQINTKLAVETAKKAKREGSKQFIFMSSIIVYGETAGKEKKVITRSTIPNPSSIYGNSKWLAELHLQKIANEEFRVAILRAPMIYGSGCKGNFPILVKLAKALPLFPDIANERSMLYIENLCEFIKLIIDNEEAGVFFPQNEEYGKTTDIVRMIAKLCGKRIYFTKILNVALRVIGGKYFNKAFGSITYEKQMSFYEKGKYQHISLEKSLQKMVG